MSARLRRSIIRASGSTHESESLEEIIAIISNYKKNPRDNFEIDFTRMEECFYESQLISNGFGDELPNFLKLAVLLEKCAGIYSRKVEYLYDLVIGLVDQSKRQVAVNEDIVQSPKPRGKKRKYSFDVSKGVCAVICLEPAVKINKSTRMAVLTQSSRLIEADSRVLVGQHFILKDDNNDDLGLIEDYFMNTDEYTFTSKRHQSHEMSNFPTPTDSRSTLCSELECTMCDDQTEAELSQIRFSDENMHSTLNESCELSQRKDSESTSGKCSSDIYDISRLSIGEEVIICDNSENNLNITNQLPALLSSSDVQFCPIAPLPPKPKTNVHNQKLNDNVKNQPICEKRITPYVKMFFNRSRMKCNDEDFSLSDDFLDKYISKRRQKIIQFRKCVLNDFDECFDSDKIHMIDGSLTKVRKRAQQNICSEDYLKNIKMICTDWNKDFQGFDDIDMDEDIEGFKGFVVGETNHERLLEENIPLESSLPFNFETTQHHVNDSYQVLESDHNAERIKRVHAWHAMIRRKIEESSRRKVTDIQTYINDVFHKILEDKQSQLTDSLTHGEQIDFRGVIASKENFEVSRYFLATMMMATSSNIEIVPSDDPMKQFFQMKLLSCDRERLWPNKENIFNTPPNSR